MQDSFLISFVPDGKKIKVTNRWSLRDAAIVAGINLTGTCGGNGVCGKCRVRLVSGDIDGEPDENGYLLACRTFPKSDCVVEVPEESHIRTPKTIARGVQESFPIDPPALKQMPSDDPLREKALGIALDIGTTTLAAALASLRDGEVLSDLSAGNPQARYGDDVISRISHASSPDGLNELRTAVIEGIGSLISELCEQAGVSSGDILDIAASGNATMNHILVGTSPESLGKAPYKPAFLEHDPVPASEFGFPAHPSAQLRLIPNIAGFVGGDTVCGILATGIYRSPSLKLFIDIGTNGEIVLGSSEMLVAASAAAGPAFEGGRIERGMRAEPGAIERAVFKGGIRISTVDNVRPRGICGTGTVQAVGCMLETGLIDKSGRIVAPRLAENLPWGLGNRIRENERGRRIVLWEEEGEEIALSQKDISEVALAKASIRAACEILLKETGTSWEDVDEVLIAGAFGSFLRAGDAKKIGLIPRARLKVRFIGNTSLEGALRVLLSHDETVRAMQIARSTRVVELAGREDFQDEFARAIPFP
jgi:uncharacterized 2Fe-2S/4Fe-4S cluster protein (DUF4445 family)